jgi:hypothetical protein
MKKIDILALMMSITYLFTMSAQNNPEGYQQFPPGTFFSITNNNSQNFEETTRKTKVQVNRPPKIINNIPSGNYPAPYSYHQPNHDSNEKPHYHHETQEYFASYYAKMKEVPTLFTLKNGLIVLGIVGCCYAALYMRLIHLVHKAKRTNGWGSFQEHIPPSDLNTLEPLALADGVIEEIKLRYPLINPSNLMPSLLLFNKDVEEELDELTTFINLYTWITTYKMSVLFPNQEKLIMRVTQKIQRLHILQDAITEWINKHVIRLVRNKPIPRQDSLKKRTNEHSRTTHLFTS